MKRQFGKTMQRIAALTLGILLTLGQVAQAETNTGLGDVAGVGADLVDSNVFTLTNSTPTLVKRAFLVSDQSVISNNAVLPTGTVIDFMIYLNNESDLDIDDVTIRDILDPLFLYTTTTIRVLNTTPECALTACDAAEELVIYNAVRAETAKSDAAAGGDTVSFVSLTVNAGDEVETLSDPQNALANTVLAVVFTVTVQ